MTPEPDRDCAFFETRSDRDTPDFDWLLTEHLRSCPRCGRRDFANVHAGFRRRLYAPIWSLFAPLAMAETLITLALAAAMPMTSMHRAAAAAVAVVAPLVFVAAQAWLLDRLVRRMVLPVLAPRFFVTCVHGHSQQERLLGQRTAVRAYARFARIAGYTSAGSYAAVGVAFAWATERPSLAIVLAGLGVVWSLLLRTRLAAVDMVDILEVTPRERRWLEDVLRAASRTHRVVPFDRSLQVTMSLHGVTLLLASVTAAILLIGGPPGAQVVGLPALVAAGVLLAAAQRWSERQLAISPEHKDACYLVRRTTAAAGDEPHGAG